jgi:hypothetical protein
MKIIGVQVVGSLSASTYTLRTIAYLWIIFRSYKTHKVKAIVNGRSYQRSLVSYPGVAIL